MEKDLGIAIAVRALGGSAARLAAALGVSRAAIAQWKKIPAERVVDVERITGVPRHMLRPDLHLEPRRNRKIRMAAE